MLFESGRPADYELKRKHVLVVCGEPRVLAEIKKGLMDSFEVSIAAGHDAALSALDEHGADAVVIYIGTERQGAFSLFAGVSAHSCGAPVLFLAERDNEDDEAAAFKMGAADYSVKRRGGSALVSRINLSIRAADSERRLNEAKAAVENDESPEAFLEGKTILIAEDIELNQKIIAAMLSGIDGLTLDFASNGKEAVEQFEENSGLYSLILMDVYMPEMDGLSAARAIRRLECKNARARKIPIIALTADVSEEATADFLEAGMNGWLEKPLDYNKFLSISAECCAK